MRPTRAILVVATGLLAMFASSASAQRPVDLRVNLSTQPVYSAFDRRPIRLDYLRATSLLGTGNIRGGRALMINRNFLEDRYFSGSLTRFYRDTTSVQDVLAGGRYGPGLPYFQPGSLTTNVATLRTSQARGADPFGAVPSSFGHAGSPFRVTYDASAGQRLFYRAQFPAQANLGSIRSEFTAESLESSSTYAAARRPGESKARMVSESSPFAGARPWWQMSGLPMFAGRAETEAEAEQPRGVSLTLTGEDKPKATVPGTLPQWQWEFLRPPEKIDEEGRPTPEPQAPRRYGLGLLEPVEPAAEGEGQAPESEFLFPGQAAEILLAPGRPRRLDEQYYQLALLDLAAGAYKQAAEAFDQAASYNLQRSWEAGRHEAWAWLLNGQFHRAAYLLQRTLLEKPESIDPQFRLTSMVDRPADWQAAEKQLEATLAERPGSSVHAFVLAYLKIFLGRAQEAEPYLKVAEKQAEYAEAVKLLREKALQ